MYFKNITLIRFRTSLISTEVFMNLKLFSIFNILFNFCLRIAKNLANINKTIANTCKSMS